MAAVNCPIQEEIISRNPEARRIPTATISPMSVGMILRTVKKSVSGTFDEMFIDVDLHQKSIDDDGKDQKRDNKIGEVEKKIHG